MKIFITCPVRHLLKEENKFILKYIRKLEKAGHIVHYPPRDTPQEDSIGLKICQRNRKALEEADRIDIYWTDKSQGTKFDLGMAFALKKPIKIINRKELKKTPHKSFVNILLELERNENET